MGYVRTAGMSTAARRARRRAALVIVAVLVGLLLVFGVAMAYVQGWVTLPGGDGSAERATATATVVPSMPPSEVSVNVYNAGGIAGAAGRAGEALNARGFAVATVANDPEGADVPGVAIVRHGPTGIEEATLLLASLPESVELLEDTRSSSSVDLVLGEQWEDLPPADGAAVTEGN